MRRLAVVAVMSMSAGCAALSPAELIDTGKRFDRTSTKSPRDAANCLQRFAGTMPIGSFNAGPTLPAILSEGPQSGTFEMQLHGGPQFGVVAFARISPAPGGGSTYAVWGSERSIVVGSIGNAETIANAGC